MPVNDAELARKTVREVPPISEAEATEIVDEFLTHTRHVTQIYDGRRIIETESLPTERLVGALTEYARTPLGRKMLQYASTSGETVQFIYDPTSDAPAQASRYENTIIYNDDERIFAALTAGDSSGVNVSFIPGDGHLTASLTTAIAHEFGHVPIGRALLGLPFIPEDGPPPGLPAETPEGDLIIYVNYVGPNQRLEEVRTTYLFENPVRQSLGLPMRRSYFEENDVIRWAR